MINVNTFKPGITFKDGNNIYSVVSSQHAQQGRGQANVKAKIKNLRTGAITMVTYTGGDKVEPAMIDKRDMDYLYTAGSNIILMDNETFEQIELPITKVEWEINFLKEGQKTIVRVYEQEVLDVELPANVELKVIEAPEAVKGNSANNPSKKVKLETGFEIEAPMFIKEGETIIVSTETGKYAGRA